MYTVDEAAEQLGVEPDDLQRWIESGELRAIDLPAGRRIAPEDLEALTARHATRRPHSATPWAKLAVAALAAVAVGAASFVGLQAFTNAPSPEGVPQVIPYQGTLAENNQSVDGQRNMEFALFDAPQSKKPTKLWETKKPVAIDVVDGKFTVNLGTQRTSNPLTKDIFAEPELFLRITVDGTALQPWQQIAPAPQAVHAANGVPPGSIIPFGGSPAEVPEGWKLCDGTGLSKKDYPQLFDAIGTGWGDGSKRCSGSCDFNVPDLRGRFMRGVAHGSGRDPDRGRRGRSMNGGNKGDKVGSFQNWATGFPHNDWNIKSDRHRHRVREAYFSAESHCGGNSGKIGTDGHNHSNSLCERNVNSNRDTHSHGIGGGDRETRPENVYVNYIIKF